VRYYFDTSALCRYYHNEPGSDIVEAIVNEPGATSLLSWLTVLEMQSAFALKVRNREISIDDFALLLRKFKSDVARRQFLVVRLLRRHFERAESLIAGYGVAQRLRTLDSLHLGVALDLRELGQLDWLVTADLDLEAVAQREGLPIKNPSHP
jgi:predicted nucleic acid-binding protein